ncbi:helix-turn-helix domain-containing protein [Loktanella fryxellensis]|nr:helix-turn-helix domain-containing protein [Loktanella fryxellensis]
MPHPVDLHVGQRIRQRRWVTGITQQQLADAVGIKFQQIQKYETGANRVSASRLWDVAQALGVPVGFFFEGLDGAGSSPQDGTGQDKEVMLLLRALSAVPDVQRRRLIDLARAMATGADGAAAHPPA